MFNACKMKKDLPIYLVCIRQQKQETILKVSNVKIAV